jgi:hypothetical protein
MFAGMAFGADGRGPPISGTVLAFAIAAVALGHIASTRPRWPQWFAAWPSPVRGVALAATISVALLLAPAAGQAFVYFHF